ncbi:MAG: methyltransferase domain-containing protein [Ahniella sp.]|nr:methyltransferase domain-containing protein [Ahniella sp.]
MRRLHIGGVERGEGWENFNAVPSAAVDHLGNGRDLGRFSDESFDLIYASHVLEHFDWRHELPPVLKEWRRVLKPGGELHVSVPDLAILCRLFLDRERLALHQRYLIGRNDLCPCGSGQRYKHCHGTNP